MWERGLKYLHLDKEKEYSQWVAPYVGAWIEMLLDPLLSQQTYTSLPMWERGLK